MSAPMVPEGATTEIAPGVHVVPDQRIEFVPNAGIVVGERAALVIDTAMGAANGERILREARRVAEERYRRVPTGELNRAVMDAVRAHPPSHVRNRLPKVFYATQAGVAPPSFVIFVNDPELIHFSYRRYLENRIRDAYGFLGTPIRLIFRARESEQAARRAARPRGRRSSGRRSSGRRP